MIPVPSSSLGPVGPASMGVCGLSSVPSHRSPVKCAARGGRRKSPPLAGGCSTAQPSFARAVGGLPHRAAMGRAAAFTLIELLVVISIIAILAALAFPAVNGAIGSARKTQARNDVQQIVSAVKAFQAEYGKFPTDDINSTDNDVSDNYYSSNKAIIAALLGTNDILNPKRIVFLEARESAKGRSGIKKDDGEFVDPWGKSYIIKLDTNYNGKTEYYGARYTSVVAFSVGPNGNPENPQGGDDICSFK